MRNNQSHFLHFSRRERSGIIVLITISILVRIVPYFILRPEVEIEAGKLDDWRELKIISDTPSRYAAYGGNGAEEILPTKEFFAFDPNTLDETGWVRLGVPAKTAASIRKYISKGGKFYKAADIRKIYGLKPGKSEELEPYVRIASIERKGYISHAKKPFAKQQFTVDVNLADSAAFESLPGIGPTLSRRIITFREKLGGFHSINQVAETFGLHDSTFQKIKGKLRMASFEVRKINVNSAEKETLQSHPYIRYKVASLIIAYRLQHGNFKHIQDIKSIVGISAEAFEKMKHYLSTE